MRHARKDGGRREQTTTRNLNDDPKTMSMRSHRSFGHRPGVSINIEYVVYRGNNVARHLCEYIIHGYKSKLR